MTTADEIRRTISVPAVLEILGLDPPDRIPGDICCPVHDDDTASMSIDEQVWYCHACGVGGGALNLVMFVGGVGFGDAMRYLEGSVDALNDMPELETKPPKELLDLGPQYEKARHSSPLTWEGKSFIAWCLDKWPQWKTMHTELQELGWAKLAEQQLWIPHRDAGGVVRGLKLRLMNNKPYGKKMSIEGSSFLTRLYRVLERPFAPLAYLVEGESDCWTMSQWFYRSPDVAVYAMPSGVGAWKPWFADELNRHYATIVCFDADEAGRRGFQKVKGTLRYVAAQTLPEGANDVTEAFAHGWRPPGH